MGKGLILYLTIGCLVALYTRENTERMLSTVEQQRFEIPPAMFVEIVVLWPVYVFDRMLNGR